MSKKQQEKQNFNVIYTVISRPDGDIESEHEIIQVKALNRGHAFFVAVNEIRKVWQDEGYRVIVHDAYLD